MNAHPIDDGVIDLALARRRVARIFVRDGVLCADEQETLAALDCAHATISDFRLRQKAAEAFALNGGTIHTGRLFRENGIVLLDEARARRLGIRLAGNDDAGPQEAA